MALAGHKKKIIPLVVLLLIAAGVGAYFYLHNENEFSGEVEALIIPHTAEVAGKIIEMPVELGSPVSPGDVLAVIDSADQEYALEQLELVLAKKKLALADTQEGTALTIAQAGYDSARLAYDKARGDYQNALTLYENGALPKSELDSIKLKADSAENALKTAQAQLDKARSTSPMSAAELDVAQTESQIEQLENNLRKYTVRAQESGIIMSKSYTAGDIVAPGHQLADIASDKEKYVVFYLPKERVHELDYEEALSILAHGQTYMGTVKFIDVKTEYTPKDMQTAANKNRDSLKIKLLLPADCPLKPGEDVTVIWE